MPVDATVNHQAASRHGRVLPRAHKSLSAKWNLERAWDSEPVDLRIGHYSREPLGEGVDSVSDNFAVPLGLDDGHTDGSMCIGLINDFLWHSHYSTLEDSQSPCQVRLW